MTGPISGDSQTKYFVPVRRIFTNEDMDLFKESSSKQMILQFVKDLNSSIIGATNDDECYISAITQGILDILSQVEQIVALHPASDQVSSRFGKPEFRDFYVDVQMKCAEWINTYLKGLIDPDAIPEVATYLYESWGHKQRIDYGSGHELNFLSFLLCLQQMNLIKTEDYKATVLKVFVEYLRIMRIIQKMYWLEPAGSHGVWGLDDYHFLPFLFGAGQLATHKHLRPISIHDSEIVEMFYKKYIYFGCIHFINSVKTASLKWHSPLIDDISGVKTWSKVNEGMIKMYDAEVLSKLPIMQHYMFGSLIPAPLGVSDPPAPGEEVHDVHNHWADCCGIKVPSAIAASQKQSSAQALRSVIPFD